MDARQRKRHQVFSYLVTIGLVAVCAAQAQTPPNAQSVPAGDTSPRPDVVTESDIKIFWLRSKNGEMVPVPDLTLEEYTKLIL